MQICASCGAENAEGAKYCSECGAALARLAPARPLEERKVVSVLFCDLVGFTEASDRRDPEDVRARIRPYHARLRHEVERYGGTVEKFVGDAVMAVFGAPFAHEDDAERAVRTGLAILEALTDLNADDPGLALDVRIGVNTGEAVVTLDARPDRGEGLVTGDVVNTASRIQGTAPVNGVAVGEQTYRATSHVFEYEPLQPVSVKGKAEPLALWRATAVRDRYGSDSVARDYRTPFVGRGLEKTLLVGVFERAAQQRSVELVTVVGEPGVGKSRLAAELFAYIDAKPELVRWRQGRCLPYGEGITFWALGEIVKAEAAILESDPPDVAAAKLDAALPADEADRPWLLQRLSPLVGVDAPPAERQELFTAWRRYVEALAGARPSVLVFDDLHWADEALLAFLEYLVEWAQGVPLLVLCAARPELYERRPGWGAGQRNSHTVNLSPLSEAETAELVAHLVREAAVPAELQREVMERAGGNPLYAEEFVRLLADRGLDGGDVSVPDTVQALIAARLDTLPPDRKSLLQDAAVVGKIFWEGALVEMAGREPADVELALHELALKELVRPARATSMEGETEYAFWHLLVGDVAYSQIPRAERARRHRAAADWIERKAGERVEDLADVLAHHYERALELAEAAGEAADAATLAAPARRYLALAGERALGLDTARAEALLARALALEPIEDDERASLLVRWADAAIQGGHPREAAEALEDALAVLRRLDDKDLTARALELRSRLSLRLGEGRHVELAAEAVELLEHEPPGAGLVAAYEQLANMQMISGAYAETIATADRAAEQAAALDLPEPARALAYRGYARAYLGDADGLDEMARAATMLSERGSGRDVAVLRNNLAIARYPFEGPAQALAEFDDAVAFCEERGLAEPALQLEGNCPGMLAELGRTDDALARAARLIATAEASGDAHTLIEVRAVELGVRLGRGDADAAGGARPLVELVHASGAVDLTVQALAAAAAASVARSQAEALELLAEGENVVGSRGTPYYARLLPGMVRTALAAGDPRLAERLVGGLAPRHPLNEHALCAARAELAAAAGDLMRAAELYGEAAERWLTFGNVAERAFALAGEGRSRLAFGAAEARAPLQEARDLFASMGYAPACAEVDGLLSRTPAGTPT